MDKNVPTVYKKIKKKSSEMYSAEPVFMAKSIWKLRITYFNDRFAISQID